MISTVQLFSSDVYMAANLSKIVQLIVSRSKIIETTSVNTKALGLVFDGYKYFTRSFNFSSNCER